MKSIRLAALGVALATGTALAVTAASPAMAQKKKKEEKEEAANAKPKPKPTPAYVKAAVPLEKAMQEKRYPDALPLLDAAKAAATTPDDKYFLYSSMAVLGSVTKNYALMEEGMKGAIDSGFASAEQEREYTGLLGVFASQRGDHAAAITLYEKAISLGNTTVSTNLGEAYFSNKQYDKAVATFNAAIAAEKAAGKSPPESWYKRVNAFAVESNDLALLAGALENWVSAFPTPENWRAVLVSFRDSGELNSSSLIDVYRLMRQTGSLKGEKDYVEYADELFKGAQYGEAQAVLDEGFSKNEVPANSVPGNELRQLIKEKIGEDRASLPNEAKSIDTLDARLTTKIANAFLSYGNHAEAVRIYNIALGKPGADTDEINTRLGISAVQTGNFAEAKTSFEKVKTAPRLGIARFWLLWLKQKDAPAPAPASPAAPAS